MNKIITILIMGMFLLVLLSTVSAYEITHRFYNETTVVTHYSDILNKNFTWRIESEQLFDECKRGIGKSYINCSVGDYNAYIRSRVDLIEKGTVEKISSISQPNNLTCNHSDLLDRIFKLESDVAYLMSVLNITIPQESEVKLYSCVSDNNPGRECPYDLSKPNKDTGLINRCYIAADILGYKTLYDKCTSGWELV